MRGGSAPLRWRARAASLACAAAACVLAGLPAAADPASTGNAAPIAAGEAPSAVERPAAEPDDGGDVGPAPSSAGDSGSADEPKSAAPSPHPKPRPAKKRRGGVNPCLTPDPGFGLYDGWSKAPSIGQMIAPRKGGITKNGGFDLLVHFHGHEPVRKEFVKSAKGIVLVGIDLGIGSGVYEQAFASPSTFTSLVASVEKEMARRTGKKKAYVRKLGLSSWSAGYGAIEQILRQPAGKKVDAVVLLDSLHAGYADEHAKTLKAAQLEPFVRFAKRAAAGQAFLFLSHSAIVPPGYASTWEVSDYLVAQLRGKPRKAKREDVLGLDLTERFDRGHFHVRGYTGNDKPDHCAHIGLIADVVKVHLQPRWQTPAARP